MKTAVLAWFSPLLVAGSLSAQTTLFSNVGLGPSGPANLLNPSYRYATDFLTNSLPSTLTNVTVKLNNLDNISHTFTASIFTDNAGSPGTLVGSFNSVTVAPNGSYADYSSISSGGISLAANTTYWEVLQMNETTGGGSAPQVAYNDTENSDAGSLFATIAATALKTSSNGGASYTDVTFFGSPVHGNYQFAVKGTQTAPEPSCAILMASGLWVLAHRRRRVAGV